MSSRRADRFRHRQGAGLRGWRAAIGLSLAAALIAASACASSSSMRAGKKAESLEDYDLAVVSVPFVLLSRMLLMKRGPGLGVALVTAIFAFILLRASTTLKVDLLQWSPIFAVLGVWLGSAIHWIMSARDTGATVEGRRKPVSID